MLVSSATDRDAIVRELVDARISVEVIDAAGPGAPRRRTGALMLDLADADDEDASWRTVAEEAGREGAAPVLVLTAAERRADIARALDLGADDAMGRPLDPLELTARTRAAIRRFTPRHAGDGEYRDALLTADFSAFKATFAGHTATLSALEARLLKMFVSHPGQLLTQERILDEVWGPECAVGGDQVKLYVSYLRRKLGMPPRGGPIHSVRGRGYRFDPPSA